MHTCQYPRLPGHRLTKPSDAIRAMETEGLDVASIIRWSNGELDAKEAGRLRDFVPRYADQPAGRTNSCCRSLSPAGSVMSAGSNSAWSAKVTCPS